MMSLLFIWVVLSIFSKFKTFGIIICKPTLNHTCLSATSFMVSIMRGITYLLCVLSLKDIYTSVITNTYELQLISIQASIFFLR